MPKATTSPVPNNPAPRVIRIRGARVHNLRNVDLDIPRGKLVVLTGPSGSGKSSLAFDTLFAEGQRQYIETLSVYARQFIHQMERPDVELIEGLQPTIAIDQSSKNRNPRSTVATVTEIHDYLRLLMARLSTPSCPDCGCSIRSQTPQQIIDRILQMPEGTKALVLAPFVRGRKGKHQDVLAQIRRQGFVRARVDGQVYDLEKIPELSQRSEHNIEAVIDRVVVRPSAQSRIAESVTLALKQGEENLCLCYFDKAENAWRDELFCTLRACGKCGISFPELEPRTFSFNSAYGACEVCEGLGSQVQFDSALLIPDPKKSMAQGALVVLSAAPAAVKRRVLRKLKEFLADKHADKHTDEYWNTPIEQLPPDTDWELLHGVEKSKNSRAKGSHKTQETQRTFPGLFTLLEKEYATAIEANWLEHLEQFRGRSVCAFCNGTRLNAQARACRLGGKGLHEIAALSIGEAQDYFQGLKFSGADQAVADRILHEITSRLTFLSRVGLDYLSLDRSADSLSGGEMQRVRLATGIGSALVGVCYLLDEPSIGLHPRDNQRLIDSLRQLQQQHNTVLVVEHDEAMMMQADYLIDVGPGAGSLGGDIVAQGTPQEVCQNGKSLTGQYLSGQKSIPVPAHRRAVSGGSEKGDGKISGSVDSGNANGNSANGTTKHNNKSIVLSGASLHNLQDVQVRIPLEVFVCVTGVSGSGKSSLIHETLSPAIRRDLYGVSRQGGPYRKLQGLDAIDKLVEVDQSPLGRSTRSNPATYCGIYDEIRQLYATTPAAKQRGYKAGRFSFNIKGGRCEKCRGQGVTKMEMNFLPDTFVTCDQCHGARFNHQTLQVRYRGHSVADILRMGVNDALELFDAHPKIRRHLQAMCDVGLGYLTLGQPSTTLSGGEAQRIKLAAELGRSSTGSTLYILDEPTTGLHFDDIRKLLHVLNQLVDAGNTVLVTEHNLDVIKSADWVIDLGPEAGTAGGIIVAAGTPEHVAKNRASHTGRYLRKVLR